MFCPNILNQSVTLMAPASISLVGIDRDNLVLMVQNGSGAGIASTVVFTDPVGGFDVRFPIYGTAPAFFRVPAEATEIHCTVSDVNATLVLGTDF